MTTINYFDAVTHNKKYEDFMLKIFDLEKKRGIEYSSFDAEACNQFWARYNIRSIDHLNEVAAKLEADVLAKSAPISLPAPILDTNTIENVIPVNNCVSDTEPVTTELKTNIKYRDVHDDNCSWCD